MTSTRDINCRAEQKFPTRLKLVLSDPSFDCTVGSSRMSGYKNTKYRVITDQLGRWRMRKNWPMTNWIRPTIYIVQIVCIIIDTRVGYQFNNLYLFFLETQNLSKVGHLSRLHTDTCIIFWRTCIYHLFFLQLFTHVQVSIQVVPKNKEWNVK
jgi:hypothetical protein